MYYWRKLTEEQRQEVLKYRKTRKLPWHRPPHFEFDGSFTFIITAACFDHLSIIGQTIGRLESFEEALLTTCRDFSENIFAWCVLPNHYHLLLRTDRISELRKALGRLHGRTSRQWNLEDNSLGRKVWYNYFDREMKSTRHYWASLNYIHNNALHHGYVEKWQEGPYSSVHQFISDVGREETARIWLEYPVLDYGKGWDVY
jgi:putative transposase